MLRRLLPQNRPALGRLANPSAVLIGTNVLMNVLRIVNTMLLTRLLSPGDFGLVAIIGSVFFIIGMITDAGFEAYIVRHERGDEPAFLDAVWSAHFGRGLMNMLVAAALAWPVAYLLRKPDLAPLLAVSAITLAIDGAASLSLLTALRRDLARRLSLIDLGAFLFQFAFGLLAAALLRNAWALVISLFVASFVRTSASYLLFPDAVHRPRLDRPLMADLWRFSRVIAASSVLTLAIGQIDKLVLAHAFSLAEFGVYAIAANLAQAPAALVGQYASRIMYPTMARTWREEPAAIRARYYDLRGLVFYGYLFAAGGLIGAAPLLVRILYDPRYTGAGLYLRLLAVTTAFTMLTRAANELLVAIGRTRATLEANIIRIAWLIGAGLAGYLLLGPIGLVAALSLIEVPPYLYGLAVARRAGVFDGMRELAALGVIAGGGVVGALVNAGGALLLPLVRG